MIKYKIEEVKKTLNNGEVESVFYIYRDYLFFCRAYKAHFDGYEDVKTEFKSLSDALSEVRLLEERNKRDFAQKTKKTETIIHKTEINCTGNNGNGCYMDSCGHNCGCEGISQAGTAF